MRRRYLGAWTLPSGNSVDVYLTPEHQIECEWDRSPSPAWPAEDVEHWRAVTFPDVLRAIAATTGERVLGVSA